MKSMFGPCCHQNGSGFFSGETKIHLMITVGHNCTLNRYMITAPGLMFSLSNVYENNHIGEKEAKQGTVTATVKCVHLYHLRLLTEPSDPSESPPLVLCRSWYVQDNEWECGVGCPQQLNGMPMYWFQSWMAVIAVHKYLLVPWWHCLAALITALIILSRVPIIHNVYVCLWQQRLQMQSPQGAAACWNEWSLLPACWLWSIHRCRTEPVAAKYEALSRAGARWWDESCCSHWQRHQYSHSNWHAVRECRGVFNLLHWHAEPVCLILGHHISCSVKSESEQMYLTFSWCQSRTEMRWDICHYAEDYCR